MSFLDKDGLAYYHTKIKAKLSTKCDIDHTHKLVTKDNAGFMSPEDKQCIQTFKDNGFLKKSDILSSAETSGISPMDAYQGNTTIEGTLGNNAITALNNTKQITTDLQTLQTDYNDFKGKCLVDLIDYTHAVTDKKTSNMGSIFQTKLYKYGRLAIFTVDIAFATQFDTFATLGELNSEIGPPANLSQNTITNSGIPGYFYVDGASNNYAFGFRTINNTSIVKIGDGIRLNLIYIANS